MAKRLELAAGKPLERRLMAAMAQLDCGACGYLCKTYAEAIAAGSERDLTRCAPGGTATAKKLRELVAEARSTAPLAAPARVERDARSADDAVPARLVKTERLNADGSLKDTRLVVLDLGPSGTTYEPGDSLGVWPENCPRDVEELIAVLGASDDTPVTGPSGERRALRDVLARRSVIHQVSHDVLALLGSRASDASEARRLAEAAESDEAPFASSTVAEVLAEFPSARPAIDDLVAALPLLRPRLYSLSSSLRAHPAEAHLTVGVVRYEANGRRRRGVASTYLAERVEPGASVRVFVHPSPHFRLPADGDVPIVMVGPGTGVAPFRAFLEERRARGDRGGSWLFFGDQRRDLDFLYRTELEAFEHEGVLTRLDTAFSRDQAEKVYVQHRMIERGAELWRWIQRGAHLYVCGDARRMARDVDAALYEVVRREGGFSNEAAREYVVGLKREGRYQRDVY
jgi:sulfite reductase (NADPH) flavoprotein alpha-component